MSARPNEAGAKIISLYPIGALMLVRVWEYEVVPGRQAEFEQLYGSAGA